MKLHFTPEQFAILKDGFAGGEPSDDYASDEMPVSTRIVAELRRLLGDSEGTLELDAEQVAALEACFTVGTEGNDEVLDVDYAAIIAILQGKKING